MTPPPTFHAEVACRRRRGGSSVVNSTFVLMIPKPSSPVGPDRAELRHQHEVPHDRQDVRLEPRRFAEEVVDEARSRSRTPRTGPMRAESHGDVQLLVFAVVNFRAAGIAAEVVPEERADETLRGRFARGPCRERQRRHPNHHRTRYKQSVSFASFAPRSWTLARSVPTGFAQARPQDVLVPSVTRSVP